MNNQKTIDLLITKNYPQGIEINETESVFLAVAAIAGWTEIEVWNPNALKVTYQGVNEAHPELGKFIPKYTESLDAIWKVFELLNLSPCLLKCQGEGYRDNPMYDAACLAQSISANTPALALCKLLLAIDPTPIAPPQVAIIDDDGEHD
jgi:hypothetical protein